LLQKEQRNKLRTTHMEASNPVLAVK
ncbi:MAG: hypothetical protein K0S65_942, partial [Labilithrix sp.]|nr:hypothetical protein [Labilithrix sp.]